MASTLIHIAVANEINKKLKRNTSQILLGSIAPDISKQIGQNRIKSHFLDNKMSLPNLNKFVTKYKNYLNDDFVLGYYIHLYTDYLWYEYFMSEIINNNIIKKLDGTTEKVDKETKKKYIYNDYSNINYKLINKYNLNLDIFYNNVPKISKIIEEIPLEKLNLLTNKVIYIVENSKNNENKIFNIEQVEKFIDFSSKIIIFDIIKNKIN